MGSYHVTMGNKQHVLVPSMNVRRHYKSIEAVEVYRDPYVGWENAIVWEETSPAMGSGRDGGIEKFHNVDEDFHSMNVLVRLSSQPDCQVNVPLYRLRRAVVGTITVQI